MDIFVTQNWNKSKKIDFEGDFYQQCSSQNFYLIIPIHQSQFDAFGKSKNFLFEKSRIKI